LIGCFLCISLHSMTDENDMSQRIERSINGLKALGADEHLASGSLYSRMRHYNVPGVSVSVVDEGALAWSRGFGLLDAEKGFEVSPDSRFHACSMSKFVTTIVVLSLVQEGILHLDSVINQVLSQWQIPENELTRGIPVSVRHLLSHQSGIVDGEDSFGVLEVKDVVPELLDILNGRSPYNSKPVEVSFSPGSRFEYSDAGFCVIQQLLEETTGQSISGIVDRLVFQPLGMTSSSFQHAVEFGDEPEIAIGHDAAGEVVAGRRATYPYLAAAGLWTTPGDLARLIVEVQKLLAGTGKLQIAPDLIEEMVTPQGCAEWTGLGVFVRGQGVKQRFLSNGWGVGFQCQLTAFPYSGSGIIIMTNSDPGRPQERSLVGELLRSVEQEYSW
jgi:CubicO group peptidase (beta-lactamase class C family)